MKRIWWIILLTALLLRCGLAVAWQSRLEGRFFFGDSESYWYLAKTIAQGEEYQFGRSGEWRIFRMPGYPVVLAPILWMTDDDPNDPTKAASVTPVMLARLENCILGTLLVAAVGWMGTLLYDRRVGVIAGGLMAVYPGAIVTSVLILAETPFMLAMVLQGGTWILALRAPKRRHMLRWAALSGLLWGACIYFRPSWLLFVPFAMAVGWPSLAIGKKKPSDETSRSFRRWAATGSVILLTAAVTLLPWWIRNYRLTAHFVPTTLQTGASLYDGLHPEATGASDMAFVSRFRRMERRSPSADPEQRYEYRVDRRMRRAAIQWAREHPRRVLELAGMKFVRLWNVFPNESAFSDWKVRLVMLLAYVPLLSASLVGVVGRVRGGFVHWLCWLPAIYLTGLHMVFVSSIRYRIPAMVLLIVPAAATVYWLWNYVHNRCRKVKPGEA